MLIFKTQTEAENYFVNNLRMVTTGSDFFKDLATEFRNWAEGKVIVEEWEKDSYDLSEASKGQY